MKTLRHMNKAMNQVDEIIYQIQTLLNSRKTTNENVYTHTNFNGGRYSLTDEDVSVLHDYIAKYLDNYDVNSVVPGNLNMSILECVTPVTNLHIDLDLHYRPTATKFSNGRYYNASQIMELVGAFNNIFSQVFNTTKDNYTCYIMERRCTKVSTRNNLTSYDEGVHIVYPYLCADISTRLYIYKKLINDERTVKALEDFGAYNPITEVLDPATFKNNSWFIYGCGKSGEGTVYQITRIGYYRPADNFTDEEYVFSTKVKGSNREKIDVLSIRHADSDATDVKTDVKVIIDRDFNIESIKTYNPEITNTNDDVQKYISLIDLVNPERAEDYYTWFTFGVILKSLSPNFQSVWDHFSAKSDKFNQKLSDAKWSSLPADNGKLSIGTIKYYAKLDNPEGYAKWCRKHAHNEYSKLLTHESYDLAQVVKSYNIKDDMIFVSNSSQSTKTLSGTWYRFNGVIWVQDYDNTFNSFIRETRVGERSLVGDVNECIASTRNQMEEIKKNSNGSLKSNNVYTILESNLKEHQRVLKYIRSNGGYMSIIEELRRLCYMSKQEFTDKFNSHINLIAFANGVYDLEKEEFRDSRPDDYISLQLKVPYVPLEELKEQQDYCEKKACLDYFFSSIFTDERVRTYVKTILSGFFEGKNRLNDMYIWTGSGSNGKSVLLKFITSLFSTYSATVSVSMFTEKRASSSSATPDVYSTIGKRLVSMQEPDSDSVFRTGLIKEMTGNDEMTARALYQDPVLFTPQFKIICCCNELPKIQDADDGGIWRRLKVIRFESRFLDKQKYEEANARDEDNIFPVDTHLIEKLEKCGTLFMNELIQEWYPIYKNGVIVPDPVMKSISDYNKSSDHLMQFINMRLEITDDPNITVRDTDLYAVYKEWHTEYIGRSADIFSKFTNAISMKLSRMKVIHANSYFNRIRIRDN